MVSFDLPLANSASASPLTMYKKLQKLAEENTAQSADDARKEEINAALRDVRNSATRVRNAQIKTDNAQVVSDSLYFRNRAATAQSVDELLNDDRALKVIANATGLGDLYLFNRDRLRAVLKSDLTDPNSVARQGSVKELEAARKFDFGRTGGVLDSNGNALTIDAQGVVRNDGSGSAFEAGLSKLKNLVITNSGTAAAGGDGALLKLGDLAKTVADDFTRLKTRALLAEEQAPSKTNTTYDLDSPEFQRFRNRSDIQREVDYYKENIKNIKSVEDFFGDSRLVRFALSAYDLESEALNKGKIRKILESDLSDQNSLANRFQDPRFQEMAKDFNVFMFKELNMKSTAMVDKVVSRYEQTKYEQSLDETAPGVRAALEFSRRAKDVTRTVQLLGDSVLREVITVANNIPKELAIQEVTSQVTALERKVDVSKFKDSSEVDKIVQRYLINKESQNSGIGGAGSYILGLFG